MALTPKQRQAQRRKKALDEGRKNLSIASVKLDYHEPIKDAIKALELGEARVHNGTIVRPMKMVSEVRALERELDKAKAEITRLERELDRAKAIIKVHSDNVAKSDLGRDRAIKSAEHHLGKAKELESELARFERTWFGYYKKT